MWYIVKDRIIPYLRLEGNEMLFIFVVYFSVYYVCYVHHWGKEGTERVAWLQCHHDKSQKTKEEKQTVFHHEP